jgi:hypothetical protein
MLVIKYKNRSDELIYSLDIIIKKFLGLDYKFEKNKSNFIEISNMFGEKKLLINASFFEKIKSSWLKKESLPELPLKQWEPRKDGLDLKLNKSSIPVIYGKSGFKIKNKKCWNLNLDIFGSVFFMLSRYEEAIKSNKDVYGRFPSSASISVQEGFLERPIVNEYLEIFWGCIKKIWSSLERKKYVFRMTVSCDVDHPYQCGIKAPIRQLKSIAADLVIRKNPLRAIESSLNYFTTKLGNYSFDYNYQTISWIMDVNEEVGNKVTFYFIAGHSEKLIDGCYSLDELCIRGLMKNIHNRGHNIGLHPSFNAYKDIKRLSKERKNLQRVMDEEEIKQNHLDSRQHFLRWDSAVTPKNLEIAGLDSDSTLTYADQVGFRSGVCYQYPLYDLVNRKKLKIIEKPLIFMEATLLSKKYNSISSQLKFDKKIESLLDTVKYFDGEFVFLWHNSYFGKSWYKESYRKILNYKNH